MNNFERHEAIDGLLAKHTARELAGMVVDARKDLAIAEELVLGDLNKIKAEAVDSYHKELLAATIAIFHPHIEGVKAVWLSKLESEQ